MRAVYKIVYRLATRYLKIEYRIMSMWRNRYTRTFEGRVEKSLGVQVPPSTFIFLFIYKSFYILRIQLFAEKNNEFLKNVLLLILNNRQIFYICLRRVPKHFFIFSAELCRAFVSYFIACACCIIVSGKH